MQTVTSHNSDYIDIKTSYNRRTLYSVFILEESVKIFIGYLKGLWHEINTVEFHPTVMFYDDKGKRKRLACHKCNKTYWQNKN